MMRCPDCKKEIRFNWEYCPHCSGDLKNEKKGRAGLPGEANLSGILWMRG